MNTLDVGRELSKHFDAASLSRGRPRFDLDEIPLVAPDSIDGFVEAIRFAAREKLCVVPTGLGSKLGWCAPPTRADFMLSTRRFTGAVSHVPDDGTITVRAGTTMAELARIVESGGHRLTPDVPRPERCTIGGVVAAGESGADRLRFGPVRHHVLGLMVLLADGTIAKCGGQLVKNVTGFDLMKLYTGSHGTLCVILEVALRLFPAPEHELWAITMDGDRAAAFELARKALALPTRIVSLTLEPLDTQIALYGRLFGRREAVDAELKLLREAWPSIALLEDSEARAAANVMCGREIRPYPPSVRIACAATEVGRCFAATERVFADARVEHHTLVEPGIATIDVKPRSSPGDLPALMRALRDTTRTHDACVELRNAPSAALAGLDPFGDEVTGLDLMRDLKRSLDPNGVFASGRFVGGI